MADTAGRNRASAKGKVPGRPLASGLGRMRLSEVLEGTGARGASAGDPEVVRVTGDSREVVPGSVFFALPGAVRDGHDFAADAARKGAVAVVAEREVACPPAALLVAPSARRAMALAAARFFGR